MISFLVSFENNNYEESKFLYKNFLNLILNCSKNTDSYLIKEAKSEYCNFLNNETKIHPHRFLIYSDFALFLLEAKLFSKVRKVHKKFK